jgi:signal transduction histidine kinase
MAAYVKKEHMVWRNDIERDDPDMLRSPFISREEVKAFVAVSVVVGGVYLGVLYVNFREAHRLSDNERRIIGMFANQVGVALQIARLLEEEQRARSNLEMLGIWNQIGGAFAHRLANIVGPVPVAVRQVRRELNKLGIESATIEEWLTQIEMATTYLRQMTERLRKVKDFRQVPEFVDINAMLSEVIRQSKLYNQDGNIKLDEQYDDLLPPVLIQKTQIQEVLMNIVNNAVDVMTSGGSLTATTRHVQQADGDIIEVTISDTGSGMTKEKQERIFELFYGEKEGGMGFGLWWSRAFLRYIKGDVQVLSERGRGSTFIVTIPLPNQ